MRAYACSLRVRCRAQQGVAGRSVVAGSTAPAASLALFIPCMCSFALGLPPKNCCYKQACGHASTAHPAPLQQRVLWLYPCPRPAAGPGDISLAANATTFDMCIGQVLAPLAAGAPMVLVPAGRHIDFAFLAQALLECQVTFWFVTPAVMRECLWELEAVREQRQEAGQQEERQRQERPGQPPLSLPQQQAQAPPQQQQARAQAQAQAQAQQQQAQAQAPQQQALAPAVRIVLVGGEQWTTELASTAWQVTPRAAITDHPVCSPVCKGMCKACHSA
jgi:hypothetical protein